MTELRISVKNLSDTGGVFNTPFWFGFHDNSFDLFNSGEAASAGLEQIAEDGDAAGLTTELTAADADGQATVLFGAGGPIAPGETVSTILDVDGASNAYVNYASMIIPSNDAFVGNGMATMLFSASGAFLGERSDVVSGAHVYDAGTEVNTELDAAFINQTAPNTGVDENGVVTLHAGFNGSLGNPNSTSGAQIILGGTNAAGLFIDPVAADFTQPNAQIVQIHINTVVQTEGTGRRDVILGGRDDDLVSAGNGNDIVLGFDGWDVLNGGSGRDFLFGGNGNDELNGDGGFDFLLGGAGEDDLSGGAQADNLLGGTGDDNLDGGQGFDRLFGGAGNDMLNGGDNNDALFGEGQNDILNGGLGNDRLFGNGGFDVLIGDSGNDTLHGGFNADIFAFADGFGNDTILDFNRANLFEKIDLSALTNITDFNDLQADHLSQSGADAVITDGTDSITLTGVDSTLLEAGDFIF